LDKFWGIFFEIFGVLGVLGGFGGMGRGVVLLARTGPVLVVVVRIVEALLWVLVLGLGLGLG
jgi:hypothetical protein